jgi:hypothetical protein
VFPGDNAAAAIDIGHVSITVASAIESVGMVLLRILPPSSPRMHVSRGISGFDGREYRNAFRLEQVL